MVRITPIYKPWSSAIWKGSHNPILRGRNRSPWLLTTYPLRPGARSSKWSIPVSTVRLFGSNGYVPGVAWSKILRNVHRGKWWYPWDIPNKYPLRFLYIYIYIRCVWGWLLRAPPSQGAPHHFPYEHEGLVDDDFILFKKHGGKFLSRWTQPWTLRVADPHQVRASPSGNKLRRQVIHPQGGKVVHEICVSKKGKQLTVSQNE